MAPADVYRLRAQRRIFGVCLSVRPGKKTSWRASIGGGSQGKKTHLGSFDNQWDAICARKSAENRLGSGYLDEPKQYQVKGTVPSPTGKTNACSIDELHQRFIYDPETGEIRNRTQLAVMAPAGAMAGCCNERGYRTIHINGKNFKAHRVIWAMQTGTWPKGVIDHINGDPSDNRWVNLRDCSQRLNILDGARCNVG